MNHTMMLIVLVTTCVMVQGQGHHRWGHRGHMVGLPSQFYEAYPESRVPIIPAPPADRWGWTGDNVFGGMIHGQMWSNGPFWDQRPDFGGQIGQWPASGQFGQNGQQWLPNYQNSWNTPLSANPVNNQWLFNGNGLSEQWSGKSQNIWPITDDQDYNGKDSNLNSDPWGKYTKLTGGNQISGNQLIGNQQSGANSGFNSGPTQNGWGDMDGSLTQNGFQPENIDNGFPVLTGISGSNSVQGINIPSGTTGITKSNTNNQNQWRRNK